MILPQKFSLSMNSLTINNEPPERFQRWRNNATECRNGIVD